jgi:hypothetical protein
VTVTEVEQQGCEKIQWIFVDFCQGLASNASGIGVIATASRVVNDLFYGGVAETFPNPRRRGLKAPG